MADILDRAMSAVDPDAWGEHSVKQLRDEIKTFLLVSLMVNPDLTRSLCPVVSACACARLCAFVCVYVRLYSCACAFVCVRRSRRHSCLRLLRLPAHMPTFMHTSMLMA